QRLENWFDRAVTGVPFLVRAEKDCDYRVTNLSISQCYNCNEISVWIYDRLVWPRAGAAESPNVDMPEDVRLDYEEASTLLDLSPRGSAALLRLGIQKLCKHLGESGKDINDDIAALVKKGLDPKIQQALDVVRVVGNNAVHPGQLDLRDDRETAEKLFGLINLIAERMISQPKHIDAMYAKLPAGALAAIQKRDAPKK